MANPKVSSAEAPLHRTFVGLHSQRPMAVRPESKQAAAALAALATAIFISSFLSLRPMAAVSHSSAPSDPGEARAASAKEWSIGAHREHAFDQNQQPKQSDGL